MKGADTQHGFTLIEVILFLAVSTLIFTGALVSIGGVVNTQRYDDSVTSLQDYLQGQYSIVDNVRNNRPDTLECTSGGGIGSGTGMPRGTSDCFIVGRVINAQPADGGRRLTSTPVYSIAGSYDEDADEQALLSSLDLRPDPDVNAVEEYVLPWQTRVDLGGSPAVFSMLILRLPTNGLLRTYLAPTNLNVVDWAQYWTPPLQDSVELCVNASGLSSIPTQGMRVVGGSAGSAGIQRIAPSEGVC